MTYLEIRFLTDGNEQFVADILISLLADIGFDSFSENEYGFNAYILQKDFSENLLNDLLKQVPVKEPVKYSIHEIPPTDWNEKWEKEYFQPILIENQCVIHSSFHKNIPSVQYDILIDPKMAFGTGHHETTSLMLSLLLQLELNNKSFLDMGCGTAVLAILASMKGANPILAIDIDEWAFANSLENVSLNKVENIRVLQGGAELLEKESPVDFIFANINRNILLQNMEVYVNCMREGSYLFMSGFYEADISMIREKAESLGLTYTGQQEKNNWVAVSFER